MHSRSSVVTFITLLSAYFTELHCTYLLANCNSVNY